MQVEQIPTSQLVPYARNSRTHSDEQVAQIMASIREFGFCNPVLVDGDNGIIAGHGRVMAASRMKIDTVPCVRLSHLSETQKRAYVIADNRIALNSSWDDEMLSLELQELHTDDFDVGKLGFEVDELATLLELDDINTEDNLDEIDAEPQVDRLEELQRHWGTQSGQLWSLGSHRLLCGDSTKADDVARLMGGAKADLCFTSPPYGAGNTAKLRDHYVQGAVGRESFYDTHEDDPESWPSLMAGWYDTIRPYVHCVVCNVQMLADNKRHLVQWLCARVDDLCDVVVWDKVNAAPQMAAKVLSNAFEFFFVFGGNGSRAIPFANFHGTVTNVFRLDPRGTNEHADVHRAVFPIQLPTWVMQTLCASSGSVVEPFCGTGTTLIAAEQLGRTCYGMEISPAYVAVILQRFQDATGKTPVLVNNVGTD